MRPDPRPAPDPAEQLRPDPLPTVRGRHDQLGGRGLLPLVDLEVADEVVVRIREEVLDGPSGASARGEQRLLGHRGDPVLLLRGGDEGEDGGLAAHR